MNLPIIDFVFLGIIVLCAIIALIRGFINEIFGMGVPIVSAWCAILLYKFLLPTFSSFIKTYILAVIISFLIVFIATFLVLKIIQVILKKIFEAKILSSLDRVLGFAFGVIEGLAFVAIILIILTAQPWFDVSSLLSGSFFYKLLSGIIAVPVENVVNAVNSVNTINPINAANKN